MPIECDHDQTKKSQVQTAVRVYWSKQRAWPGDKVKIHVRSERIADDTAVELKILAKQGGDTVDTITGQTLKITGGKLDHEYTLDWSEKDLGAKREFVVQAKLGGKLESEASEVLVVDLDLPLFSA